MKVCVLGLGHIGAVSAACLARDGHEVIAVDAQRSKVELVNAGHSPIAEKDLEDLVGEQVGAARLSATTQATIAVQHSDLVLVCVRDVQRACAQIGRALAEHPGAPVIVFRTSLLPGTTRGALIPALEKLSGKRAGEEFGVCVNPHFMREGSAIHDHDHPSRTVIGELNRASGDLAAVLWARLPGPALRTDLESAEMIKHADNSWHALKIGFANEIGSLCKALDVDAHGVMEMFCRDHKLNLSPAYLKPGFAFGGGALPRDVGALLARAKALDLDLPILSSILPSNELQIERGVQAVVDKGNARVGILGFAFKAGTGELRGSPMLELVARLLERGFDLRVYDPGVRQAALRGTSLDELLERTTHFAPNLARIVVHSLDDVLDHAQTIVIGSAAPEFADVPRLIGDGQTIIDLVRVCNSRTIAGIYEGLCW